MITRTKHPKQTFDEEVPVNEIFLDRYGRPPNQNHIDRLVTKWNRAYVGVITLSLHEDGRYACLDGWHRVTACRLTEGKQATMRADVYIDLSYQEEAKMWHELNKVRRSPSPFEIFNSWLEAGDMRAEAIDAVVQGCGLALSPHRRDGGLTATASVLKVYDMDGGGLLEASLKMLRAAWVNARAKDRYPAPAIEGLALFLLRYPDADRARLIQILQSLGPQGMQAEALQVRKMEGTSAPICWGKALRLQHNYKMRSGRLPEWPERIFTPTGRDHLTRVRRTRITATAVKRTMTPEEEAEWERTRGH